MPNNNEARDVNNTATAGTSIDRASIKIPPFWPEKPSLWFVQLEGQFALNHITQDTTKYYYVSANLDSRYASEVEDILLNPPEADKYNTLKQELIKRLSTSREQKIKQLLEHEEIGDRTPSQFLRHLKNLAGNEVPGEFLRTLWIGRLPSNMQAILATQTNADSNAISALADKIAEVTQGSSVASVSTNSANSEVAQLTKQVSELTLQVQELIRGRAPLRSRSQQRPRSASRAKLCWYHRRFQSKARKCIPPCEFDTSKNESGSQ